MKLFLLALAFVAHAEALELEGKQITDTITSEGITLPLKGAALRDTTKFGMKFKVYVAGLYFKDKTADAEAVIASEQPKVLRIQFLRSLDKETLTKAFKESHAKNCEPTCKESQAKLDEFVKLLSNFKEDSKMTFTFFKTKLKFEVEVDPKHKNSGVIESPEFSKNLLKMYIGLNPPTAEFKKALVGG